MHCGCWSLSSINFTQSGSKKRRQQSGEWRNKEWGSQLCHAILTPLSPRATPSVSHSSSLSLVQSQWCMTTITEHNDSSARNLLFHCKAKKEEDLRRKRRGDKTTWERGGGGIVEGTQVCGGGWGRWCGSSSRDQEEEDGGDEEEGRAQKAVDPKQLRSLNKALNLT